MATRIAVFSSLLMLPLLASRGLGDGLPPDTTYRPLPTAPLDAVKKSDTAAKPAVMQRQARLLSERYAWRTVPSRA
jgi:cytochrome c peroxidase